jgi:NhaP-type Na+/H+ or K+/H+ antiporter
MPGFLTSLVIIAFVLLIAAIFSGLVERSPVSFPMIFLGLGFLIGGHGLGIIQITPQDPTLETIATLSLSFVLFLDALNLRFDEIGRNWLVPFLSLGPGTLLTIILISLGAAILLRLSPVNSLLLGAILSSVDPVLLRDVVRDERIPRSIRQSLKMEAGTNDVIVLPILLVLVTLAVGQTGSTGSWVVLLVRLFLLGPLVGAIVGAVSAWLMNLARKYTVIRREYRSLYGVGILVAAYFAGEIVGGSGFLAVFASGLAMITIDFDLCDCFLEFGEVISEMTMLLAFLLFGAMLSAIIGTVALLPVLGLALVTLLIARPVAISLVLRNAQVSKNARLFIGWFGPRGLSSLLFGLLLVTKGVPGSEGLLAAAGIVVIISVIAHGVTAAPLAAWYSRSEMKETLPEERESSASELFRQSPDDVPRITAEELAGRLQSSTPPVVLDVRSRSTYDHDEGKIPGSIRVLPDDVNEWASGKDQERSIVTYCT